MIKLEMAHEFAMKLAELKVTNKTEDIIRLGWEYADAMQAEADKRGTVQHTRSGHTITTYERPEVLREASDKASKEINDILENHEHVFVDGRICWCGKIKSDLEDEWQPDWSVAPLWAVAWTYREKDDVGIFWSITPAKTNLGFFVDGVHKSKLSTMYRFGYQGSWENSLRKRP